MNRAILMILVGTVALVLGAVVLALFLFPSKPAAPSGSAVADTGSTGGPQYIPYAPSGPQGPATSAKSETEIQSAFAAVLASDNNPDNIRMEGTVVAGEYALVLWSGNVTGGEALLKYDAAQGGWSVASMGGGAWTVESLVTIEGVPQDIAAQLVAGATR